MQNVSSKFYTFLGNSLLYAFIAYFLGGQEQEELLQIAQKLETWKEKQEKTTKYKIFVCDFLQLSVITKLFLNPNFENCSTVNRNWNHWKVDNSKSLDVGPTSKQG